MGTGCTIGKGECPACLISVKAGADLLSPPSAAEQRLLSEEQLDQSLRLACQVKIENPGEVVVMASARKPGGATRDTKSEVRKDFGSLPLNQKIATLLQLEAITMSEAFDSAIEKPLAFGAKTMDALIGRVRAKNNKK